MQVARSIPDAGLTGKPLPTRCADPREQPPLVDAWLSQELGAGHHLDEAGRTARVTAGERDRRARLVTQIEQAIARAGCYGSIILVEYDAHLVSIHVSPNSMVSDPEVLIIGGGPAGSALGALLAKRGRRSLIIEREEFPRFHIGESLLPHSMQVFEELDLVDALEARFIRKYGARFVEARTGYMVRYEFAEAVDKRFPYAFEVQRDVFDQLLIDRAKELGAAVLQPCKVKEVLFEGERAVGLRVTDAGGERELRAPLVVDATGRGSMLASRNRTKDRIPGLNTASMFTHYRGAERYEGDAEGDITVVTFDEGWIWFIPLKGDVTSVGTVLIKDHWATRRSDESYEDFFDRTVESIPWAKERLASAERIMGIHTAADFSYSVDRMAGDGWLTIGDAYGFIDPLFSSGVHMALIGARLCADAIDAALDDGDVRADHFAGVERDLKSASDMFLGIVLGNYKGSLGEYLYAKNQRKVLRQCITSLLSGDVLHGDPVPTWARFMREHFSANVTS